MILQSYITLSRRDGVLLFYIDVRILRVSLRLRSLEVVEDATVPIRWSPIVTTNFGNDCTWEGRCVNLLIELTLCERDGFITSFAGISVSRDVPEMSTRDMWAKLTHLSRRVARYE